MRIRNDFGGEWARAGGDFQTVKISITRRGGIKVVLENPHHRPLEKSKAPGANLGGTGISPTLLAKKPARSLSPPGS